MILIGTQIRENMIISLDGELYRVMWCMHRTPGKGDASMQTKLKHVVTGKNLDRKFRSDEKVERAELDTKAMQYLYAEADDLVFMDQETYEQVMVSKEMVGEDERFVFEGQTYNVTFYDGMVVGLELPKTVDLKVTLAPPTIKRATVTNSMRPVELENGMSVPAPGFVKTGDTIRIKTDTLEYVERVS